MEKRMGLTELPEIPKTLEEFRYYFNEKGQLRHKVTQEPFAFNYYKNALDWNHRRYEALNHIITQHVYGLLEKECNLTRIWFPVAATEHTPRSFFYMSEGALANPATLIVLLQDRGVIRAGQWSQQAIIHDCLNSGTQIPFIKYALKEHCGVIVLNPNDNFLEIKAEDSDAVNVLVKVEDNAFPESKAEARVKKEAPQVLKKHSSSPEEHTMYIWDYFIANCAAKNVAFVTHGYGGLAFVDLLIQRTQEVELKVFAVAFIASVHNVQHQGADHEVQSWIHKHCRSWVLSSVPINRPVPFLNTDCPRVSAGTERPELAPWLCLNYIFKFLRKVLKDQKPEALSRSPIATRSFTKKNTEL
uniref:Si:ch73-41e3.7 n=2 Tax=Latimeria chalumnae TaxID=7897 RepID=H2ZWE0_LATCH